MKSLPSPTRVLRLGLSLFLTVVLAACGGGEAPADPAALIAKTPVIRCAP